MTIPAKESVFKDVSITFVKIKQLYILQTVSFSLSVEGNGTTSEVISGSLCSGIYWCGLTSVHAVTKCSSKD